MARATARRAASMKSSDKALGMTPATYAKGGAGAHIDYTTVDSDYGRVLVAATQKGIAAVFLGDSDRTLERDLKHDFPAADIERNDEALAPRVKGVLARLYGRKPIGARCARRAARYRRHRLPMESLEGADRDPGGPDPHLRRDRQGASASRRRPAPSAAPAPPTRRPASFPATAPSAPTARSPAIAGAWRARSGCWPRNAGAAARRRRRCRRGADGRAARPPPAPGSPARSSQPRNSARMRPPNTRPPSRRRPLPVTISTTRRFCADESARKCATARSAAVRVMPCRSSLASGARLPLRQAHDRRRGRRSGRQCRGRHSARRSRGRGRAVESFLWR